MSFLDLTSFFDCRASLRASRTFAGAAQHWPGFVKLSLCDRATPSFLSLYNLARPWGAVNVFIPEAAAGQCAFRLSERRFSVRAPL